MPPSRPWQFTDPPSPSASLREAVGGHPLVTCLLAQRGIVDPARARAFLDPALYSPASPYALPGMTEAEGLLRETIAQGGRIRIWGDLDADGHTATAVLQEALAAAGADVDYALPSPQEGHGLHRRAVEEALQDEIALLITCDTGIGDGDMVQVGVEAGLVVIVTDHHDLPEALPPAQAVVNPKMLQADHPLYALSGVGVAYMVAQALLPGAEHEARLEAMLDLVALGLVADRASQVDDVRYLIQRGLAVMRRGQRMGIAALAQVAGFDLAHASEHEIGYYLAPRLNAAGRLADSESVVQLLLTENSTEAERWAGRIEALHQDRRARVEAALAQAEALWARDPERTTAPAIILESESWESGVLGVVASRLVARHDRPAILIAHRPGLPSTASARSVEGVDIHEAIAAGRQFLLREGGHPMAAGFSIERELVPAMRSALKSHLAQVERPEPEAQPLMIDAELRWGEIDLDLARDVDRLAPFGTANPQPLLALLGARFERHEKLGSDPESDHARLHLSGADDQPLQVVWFHAQELPQPGEPIDVALRMRPSYWRGRERLDLQLVDWRAAVSVDRKASAVWVAGRELVDLRGRKDRVAALRELRERHGDGLVIWAEGLERRPEGALTRWEMAGRSATALAIAAAPPSPEALRSVLANLAPQLVWVLQPQPLPEPTVPETLRQVAGMLRVALRDHSGRIDLPRMAARLGLSEAAILLALREIEVRGEIALREADGELIASRAGAVKRATRSPEQMKALRQTLTAALRETHAYRQDWATLPLEMLLAEE